MKLAVQVVLALGLATGGFVGARALAAARSPSAQPASPLPVAASELHVSRIANASEVTKSVDAPEWADAVARTGAFVGAGGTAGKPFSEASFLWSDGQLHVRLYAADEDIRAARSVPDDPVWLDDSFHLAFSDRSARRVFDVSALGVVTDALQSGASALDYRWQSGARAIHDVDGTPNEPSDRDEEWVVVLSIPLSSLGLKNQRGERVGFEARRCDTPKGEPRLCATWGAGTARGALVLD